MVLLRFVDPMRTMRVPPVQLCCLLWINYSFRLMVLFFDLQILLSSSYFPTRSKHCKAMMPSHLSSTFLLSCLLSSSSAFTSHRPALLLQRRHSTTLNVGASLDWNAGYDQDFLMQRADACAHSDSCSLEESTVCLDAVIHIQSGCSSGVLIGDHVCENADTAAEIVANLRQNIDRETKRLR
jgi:hypothetical protein